jgi:hypothetical protein
MTENSKSGGIPVTWSELLAESGPSARYEMDYLRSLPARLASRPPRAVTITLGSAADTFSIAEIVLGPAECLPLFPPLEEHLVRALGEFEGGIRRGSAVRAVGLLNYLNAARCCGAEVPSQADGVEPVWLQQIAQFQGDLTESESKTMALAVLASALVDLVPTFIGGAPVLADFKPGETFGFNVQGFVRYVAAAIRAGAASEAVELAWRDFVDSFPRKLASQTLGWVDLLWAARSMMVHFEHRPVETVAAALHEFVT